MSSCLEIGTANGNLTYRHARPRLVKSNEGGMFLYAIIFSFLLEPKLFVKLPLLNFIYIAGAITVFFYLVYRSISINIIIKTPLAAAFLYRMVLFFPTILYGGEILDWGYYTMTLLSMIMLFAIVRDCRELKKLLQAARITLLLYLGVNLATMIIWPNGVIENLFFLGIRTRITEVAFAAVGISMIVDYFDGRRTSAPTIFIVSFSLVQFSIQDVTTALVGSAVCLAGYVALNCLKPKSCGRVFKFIFISCMLLSIAVCVFHAQYLFRDIIEDVLNKSVTLSYREGIWNEGISLFMERPFLGFGIVDNGNHIATSELWGMNMWQAHNNLLQLLLDGGLIATGFFCAIIYSIGSSIERAKYAIPRQNILLAIWLSYNVMSISEIFVFQNYYFLFLLAINSLASINTSTLQEMSGTRAS